VSHDFDLSETKQAAQNAAKEMLKACWAPEKFPVDPYSIAEKAGAQVTFIELPNDVAGGLLKEPDSTPIIFINQADHPNRKRFTCAHELGHFYKRFTDKHYEYYDNRNAMSSSGENVEEVFANQFAANLLMPEEAVKAKFSELRAAHNETIAAIVSTSHFGVSQEALNFRLNNLGLI